MDAVNHVDRLTGSAACPAAGSLSKAAAGAAAAAAAARIERRVGWTPSITAILTTPFGEGGRAGARGDRTKKASVGRTSSTSATRELDSIARVG